jgi:hypothetical protein
MPGFTGASAEGLRKTGQFEEEALLTIDGAIARATNSGVELDLSELLRIKSQILAARNDRESAMNYLTGGGKRVKLQKQSRVIGRNLS